MDQYQTFLKEFPEYTYVGQDFDIVKRNPKNAELNAGNVQRVFKFMNNDRMIPSRRRTTSEFLSNSPVECYDITSASNSIKTMKKVQYQNYLRSVYLEQQQEGKGCEKDKKPKEIKLIHLDWACKIANVRQKFLPDFETLKKPGFGIINNYLWSNKHIIAASSDSKVCLYHPFNGFTRALDVHHKVCMAFTNSGDFLTMAYRKSLHGTDKHDIFNFRIDHQTLFDSENLDTEKIISPTSCDITALSYTRNDCFLMCGTNVGKIIIIECSHLSKGNSNENPKPRNWRYQKTLATSFHKHEIRKISFSANHRYMASLDYSGRLVIWNGGSWTVLFSLNRERSRLYKYLEWHPFVEEELIVAKSMYPALYLINVVQQQVVACHLSWKEDMEITSIAFNPITAQLAVNFYLKEEYINRVSILASMSQVINTFDFDYINGGLKLFWNSTGTMLGAGAQRFRFAFWSFNKNNNFAGETVKDSSSKNQILFSLNDSKFNSIR